MERGGRRRCESEAEAGRQAAGSRGAFPLHPRVAASPIRWKLKQSERREQQTISKWQIPSMSRGHHSAISPAATAGSNRSNTVDAGTTYCVAHAIACVALTRPYSSFVALAKLSGRRRASGGGGQQRASYLPRKKRKWRVGAETRSAD